MIVVSSATLASKELTKIEAEVEKFAEGNLEEVIIKPSKTASEVLSDENLDLSKALIISPALVDEVRAIQKSKIDSIKPVKQSTEVFTIVEENAEFEGGMEGFGKYLSENLKYPEAAQKANISGKIYTEFIVNTDGSASDFKTLKGIGFGCEEEAIRVLQMAKWNPGKQSGRIVRSKLVVPIQFALSK
jgi:periplasmic protein TonB